MSSPTLVITIGDEEFKMSPPTVQEVIQVEEWTGFSSWPVWDIAIRAQNARALLAAYGIVKRRKGEPFDFATAGQDLPASVVGKYVTDTGREVDIVMQTNADGSVIHDKDGNALAVLDSDGKPQWRDVESGAVVPFGETAGEPTSPSTEPEPSSSGGSDIGIPTTGSV